MHSHALSTAKEVGLNGATAQKPVALEHGLDYIPSNVKELMVVLHAQRIRHSRSHAIWWRAHHPLLLHHRQLRLHVKLWSISHCSRLHTQATLVC